MARTSTPGNDDPIGRLQRHLDVEIVNARLVFERVTGHEQLRRIRRDEAVEVDDADGCRVHELAEAVRTSYRVIGSRSGRRRRIKEDEGDGDALSSERSFQSIAVLTVR